MVLWARSSMHKSKEKCNMSEIDDVIAKSFEIRKRLGRGAYGIVWKALDRNTNKLVAVKKIFDAFRNETDAQRTFREIMFLRAFRNHPNIIQLYSVHKASNNMDIYLSFEFMESDLHNVIKRGNVLKEIHKRYIMYQLLNAIMYMHSGNVIHRDLKPSNVLIDSQCRCKIADFGLARSVANTKTSSSSPSKLNSSSTTQSSSNEDIQSPELENNDLTLTDYVATRWYRAPEILIASKRYTKGIDMWSLGCVLGEMIRGKPLFPGSCTINQIERIVQAIPQATEDDLLAIDGHERNFGSNFLVNFNKLLSKNNSTTNSNKEILLTLDELLCDGPDDGVELTKSLLVLDPLKRLTAKEALKHGFVERFRKSGDENELNKDVVTPFRDDIQLSVNEYRSKIYEIMSSGKGCPLRKDTSSTGKKNKVRGLVPRTTQLSQNGNNNGNFNGNHKFANCIENSSPGSKVKYTKGSKINPTRIIGAINGKPQEKEFAEHCNCSYPTLLAKSNPSLHKIPSQDSLPERGVGLEVGGGTVNNMVSLNKRHSIDGHYYTITTNCPNKFHVKTTDQSSNKDKVAYIPLENSHLANLVPAPKPIKSHRPCHLTKSTKETDQSYKSQKSVGMPQDYYENRLKVLEDKIRKHKQEMNTFLSSGHGRQARKLVTLPQSKIKLERTGNGDLPKVLYAGQSNLKQSFSSSSSSNQSSLKKEDPKPFRSAAYPNPQRSLMNRTNCDLLSSTNKLNKPNSYGVISASDLYKLRSSQLIS